MCDKLLQPSMVKRTSQYFSTPCSLLLPLLGAQTPLPPTSLSTSRHPQCSSVLLSAPQCPSALPSTFWYSLVALVLLSCPRQMLAAKNRCRPKGQRQAGRKEQGQSTDLYKIPLLRSFLPGYHVTTWPALLDFKPIIQSWWSFSRVHYPRGFSSFVFIY